MRNLLRVLIAALALVAFTAPPALATNDPGWDKQWAPPQMNAPSGWAKSKGGGVTIAIVDSGVDVDHPDLRGKIDFANSFDYGDEDTNPDDDSTLKDGSGKGVKGHGTHVAGTAAAITDNGTGIAGVAPDAKIMAMKVFPSSGSTVGFAAVPRAIRDAADRGAKVINLSLGTFNTGVPLVGVIETPCFEVLQKGALCVVSSGNGGANRASGYRRDFPGLIVTAHTKEGTRSSFGQKADTQWAVSAPGVEIYATYPVEEGGYATLQGTSMSAPNAAGVAALVYAALKPPATQAGAQQVIDAILSGARGQSDPGSWGAGMIDAAGALKVPVQTSGSTPTTAFSAGQGQGQAATGGSGSGASRSGGSAASSGGASAGSAGQPAPSGDPGAVTDDTAPDTEGIQLATADGAASEDKKSPVDGGKATLYAIAGMMVLATGGMSASTYAKGLKSKRLKPFSEL
ncbi:MAG: S8 family serine peptidase [Acidimicrobiales bacterium]